MRLYPAIDLKDGKCVRLLKGDMNAATTYNDNPAAQAHLFADAGFDYLHVVDLNGAVSGARVNEPAVRAILEATNLPVQLGGGIRDADSVAAWLDSGVSRVILGTAAVKNPALVKEVASAFPGRVVVGIDARDGMVATEGWVDTSKVRAIDLAKKFEYAGVAAIIYTDIGRDGTMAGPNLEDTAALARAMSIPVILSGGIGSLGDLKAIREENSIEGVILGRALYERKINPQKALKLAAG